MGARNQYRDVPYFVFEGGSYKCLLCETGGMGYEYTRAHTNGRSHGYMYDHVKGLEAAATATLQKETDRMQIHKVRVEKLGLESWQLKMKALMFDYLTSGCVDDSEVVSTLSKFWKMERLSLLELALWKAKICDGVVFFNMQEMREYIVLEEDFQPDVFAREMRITSGCHAIIPLVSAFLG